MFLITFDFTLFLIVFQVLLPPGSPEYPGMAPNQQMYILDEEDCPLAILMQFPPNKGMP